jgi:hypothetical protein
MCRQPGHPRQDNGPASGVSSSPACAVTRGPSGEACDLHAHACATGDKRRYEALKHRRAGRREAAQDCSASAVPSDQDAGSYAPRSPPASRACFGRTREIAERPERNPPAVTTTHAITRTRHCRACPGNPIGSPPPAATPHWMPGTRPDMKNKQAPYQRKASSAIGPCSTASMPRVPLLVSSS